LTLASLSYSEKQELLNLLAEKERRKSRNKLATYDPYPKQREFHAAGKDHRERLLMAANQVGKTWSGGAEWAIHLTGRYPDWWGGKVFNAPVRFWAAGNTSESTRDTQAVESVCLFKSYEQGRQKWQGDTLHGVWNDEEPPPEIYSEGLTRTNATEGIVMTTFTPLLGMSEVVMSFLTPEQVQKMTSKKAA
jgi:phage terminase large subunit-like protein